ncbi:CHASE2 domain-containing protein [Microcoleus sp. FACHB-831]|uniref:CHASE2 domain-containing protein n=1 Tax=Microcoleus sp. FACHB-831 TaxID=2692827 RepID=UPI001688977D|nr:CHASE2 domain-containing protein [Microcoleus sp. FACHB-831]MBD1921283.1 CHASE2 domain-containing protein [Microcoleus sp. FACHB-831]
MISNFLTKIRQGLSDGNGKTKSAFDFGRTVLLTSVVVTALLGGARYLGALEGLELGAYDQMLRSRSNEGPDDRLLLVGISENDLMSLKEYPISDGTLAQALEKLEQHEPRAIGIDILRDIPQGKGREALIEQMKSDRVIAVCKLSSAIDNGIGAAPGVSQERVGFADFPLDPGGTLRRSLLISTPVAPKIPVDKPHLCNYADPENQVISFGLQLAMLYLQPQGIEPEPTPSGEIKLGSALLKRIGKNAGSYHNADAENDYQMLLNYRSVDNPAKQVTLTEVLEGKIDPALVKDRVVLIGYTAQSVKDYFVTPYSGGLRDNQTMPGVVAHAQNVSQILSAALNNRPLIWYWPDGYELLWLFGWSLVGGTLAWSIRKPLFLVLAIGGGVIVLVGTCYVLFTHSGWIPVWPPLLGLVLTAGGIVLLDRGAAKAIYAGVKKVLKLNIEIDESKKQAEVAEITESDFFKDLQQKADEIRSRDSKGASNSNSFTQKAPPTREESEAAEIDYFEQLQQKARLTREQRSESENNTVSDSLGAIARPENRAEADTAPEIDYFEQLQQKARQTREQHSDPESKTDSLGAIALPENRAESQALQLDYFEQFQHKASQTREQHSDGQTETVSQPQERLESESSQIEFLQRLQQKASQAKLEYSEAPTEIVLAPTEPTTAEDKPIGDFDFLQRLQQKASQAKLEYSEAPTEIVLDPTEPTTASGDESTDYEPLGEFDFLQRLQQKASQAKLEYSEAPTEIVSKPKESTTASSEEYPESQPLGDFDFLQRLQQSSSYAKPQYSDALNNIISSTDEATTLPDERTNSEDVAEISFLQRLQQKAREARVESSEVPSEIVPDSTEPSAGGDEAPSKSESTQPTDYFEQFQQKARQSKNKDDGNNT